MGSNPPPPSATRLRSNKARLDSITNAAFCMETAVSSSECRAAAGMPSQGSGSLGHFMNLSLLDENSVDSVPEESKPGPKWSRAHLQGAMQQVDQLKAGVAGMEAVVAAVRGYYNKRTVTGRRLPKLVSQAAMRERAQEIIKLRHKQLICPSGAESKVKASRTQLAPLKFDVFFEPGHHHKLPLSDIKESSSREDAKLLRQHLEEVLPDGAISSKYRRPVGTSGDALQLYSDVLKLRQDYEIVDSTLRESGRHLAAECTERAQVTEQVRKRYAEMFNAVFYVLCIVHEALNQTKIKHDEMSGMWEDMQQQLRVAKAKAAMEKRLREESLASVEAEREELQNVAATLKEEMTAVRKENQSLAAALECEMESFNSKMKAREEATAFAQQGLQAELESARDDCDDLQRQLRMAERNLARLRRPKEVDLGKSVKATQTDAKPSYPTVSANRNSALLIAAEQQYDYQEDESEDEEASSESSEEGGEGEAKEGTGKKSKKCKQERIRRRRASSRGHGGDVTFAAQGSRRASMRRNASERGRSGSRNKGMVAAGELVSLQSRVRRAQPGRRGASAGGHAASSPGGKRRGRRGKSASAAEGGVGGSEGSEDELDPELDDMYDSLEDEDDLDMDSLAGSNAEDSVHSEDEEEEDIEEMLAAMEAEGDWPDDDSEEDGSDTDVTDAEHMDEDELHAALEEKRQAKQERKAARRIAKRQAWREANIKAHEEKMKEKMEAKAAKKALREAEKELKREERVAAKKQECEKRAQQRKERQALAKARRELDAEKKLKKGRNASAPPTVSRKDAKKDAAKLEQMKPTSGISRKAFKAKRKTAKLTDVGGFSGIFKAKMKGRVKGMPWLMKQVVSIYADYLVQEKYMSRDGEPGQFDNFNHFVYKWHMSQFGLKQIAEMNLIDLIATLRANAAKHHQLQVFGKVIHILPGGDSEGSLDHIDYYLFCMRSLAGKKPMQTLFTADGNAKLPNNLVVSGIKTICSDALHDDALRDSLIKQLDMKDLMKGTIAIPEVMPLLMAAFQRKFALAQLHQEALMNAVDIDRDGYLDWEGFSMAAILVQQSLWGKDKDENDALHAFHGACKLSKSHNCCTVQHAIMKLRAHLGRLWSLEPVLPAVEMIMNDDGVPVLPATYAATLQAEVETLRQSVERIAQANPTSPTNGRLVSLFHHVADTVGICAQGRENMEVGFAACHVLQALCLS